MQKILLVILGLCTAVSAWFALQYRGQLAGRDAEIAALKSRLDSAATAEKAARDQVAPLAENVARLTTERDQLKAQARIAAPGPVPAGDPSPQPGTGGKEVLGGMAKMFQSEEGKKMLRAQTTMMVKMQYADLARRLGLSPQETDQLLGLLADRQNAMTGDAFGMISDSPPAEAKLKELTAKAEASRKEYDEKLKATLGDERFKRFQEYERTIGDRMMMTQLEPQLASAGAPLDPAQKEQLIQIMSEERLKAPPSVFDPGNKDVGAAMNALKDDAAVDRWLQQEQDFQRRVLQSATKALSPDQVNALQQAFQQTAEMQKFGIKMSREMFKGQGGENPPPPPVAERLPR